MATSDLETQLINELRCRLISLSAQQSAKHILAILLAILAAGASMALLCKAWETIKDGEEPEDAIQRAKEDIER